MHLFSECLIDHRLIIPIYLLNNINSFLFHVRQILADKLMKNCPYYRVKWIGINKQGCTWEPKEHLQGEKAQTIMRLYLEKKQAELVALEEKNNTGSRVFWLRRAWQSLAHQLKTQQMGMLVTTSP